MATRQMSFIPGMNQSSRCRVVPESGGLVFFGPYDPRLVVELKTRIPTSERKFDPVRKAWIVSPSAGKTLVAIVDDVFGEELQLPLAMETAKLEQRILRVRYIGACKDRNGESIAFGMVDHDWSVLFPEHTLRDWFEAGPEQPPTTSTLYAVLGIKQTTNIEEIKSSYRRMVKQWHPDVCKEVNAQEVFIQVQHAYSILSDDGKRARYDAGLKLEATLNKTNRFESEQLRSFQVSYRSPLRCGWIMCEGVEKIGRFVVEKIIAWEDIVENGSTLVVSWPNGATEPLEIWS